MAIAKVPKQRMPSKPREVKEDGKARCDHCNTTREFKDFRFAATSLMDESQYLCDLTCYKAWLADRANRGLGPWGAVPET